MKTKINIFFGLLVLFFGITACENDGERLYLTGLKENELTATRNDVVLSQETASEIVLSLTWNKSTLSTSNPDVAAPDVLSTYIQISTQNDFSSNVTQSLEKNLSKAYTGSEMNTIAKNLGLSPDVATTIYFRLLSRTGNNMEPAYSNTVTINVTSYAIDMSLGFILDEKENNTGRTLASPQSNGIYTGFMGVTGWANFYMQEGDGTIWGNINVDGSAFVLSSDNEHWNFWFPGQSGCYYTTVNTVAKEWSALWLPVLTVSGDIKADMIFDRPNVKWTTVFNATAAATLKIKLNANGQLYNRNTGDSQSVETPVSFARESDKLVLASQAGDISVSIPAAGEYTLVVDLSNPNAWTCQVVSGSTGPEEINPHVYLPGIDDGISGSWTFDNYLTIFDEDELTYAGVINVNSLWGYSINTEKDNWDDKYVLDEGDAYSGTLLFQGTTNLPTPTPGLYLIETSLKKLTYDLKAIGDEIYVAGINDDWGFLPLAATATPGIFAGDITISKASEWGFQIHLDTSWDYKIGGSDGKLYYQGNNLTDDANLLPGVYRITVNLIAMTCNIQSSTN